MIDFTSLLAIICSVAGIVGLGKLFVEYKKAIKKITVLAVENKSLADSVNFLTQEFNNAHVQLTVERDYNKKLLSQKKSSETRLGQITEQLVPFLDNCPYEPKNMHFLGQPTDYVHFDFDEGRITFVEVKSGNSRASKRQKTIKNIINAGRVFYDEIRINSKGVNTKTKNKK